MTGTLSTNDSTRSLVQRFAARCERDDAYPDVFRFLEEYPAATVRQKADVFRLDQSHRWKRGEVIPVEEYCARCPDVAAHHRLLVELIASELDLRAEFGQPVDLEPMFQRFPDIAESIWSLLRKPSPSASPARYSNMIRQVFDDGYLVSTLWGDRSVNQTHIDWPLDGLPRSETASGDAGDGIFLMRCPPFAQLPGSVLRLIESQMHEANFPGGSYLLRQGTAGTELMVLCEGTVEISTEDEQGERHIITRTERIQVLGEMALLSDEPRMASVLAVSPVRVLVLPAERFHELTRQFPALCVVLTLLVAGRLGRPDRDDVLMRHTLAGYRIRRQLGRGGMSVVYQADAVDGGQTVALKMMSHRLVYDDEALQQFQHEADVIERFEHANIVRMLGRFRAFHTYFIVMEYCDGETLRDVIQRIGPLPVDLFRRMLGQIACALSFAHAANVIHRDIKPANIMLNRDGTVKLMDFGLARPILEKESPADERFAGTPRYMSPEQVMGDVVTRKSDYFSLGLVAWEMLSGCPLILENEFLDLLRRHANWEAPDFRKLAPALDEDIVQLLEACLCSDPADRPDNLSVMEGWSQPLPAGALGRLDH